MSLNIISKQNNQCIARINDGNNKYQYVEVVYDENKSIEEETRELSIDKDNKNHRLEYIPYVQENQRVGIYISGMSGSGKSTVARYCIEELRKIRKNKKMPVVIITSKEITIDTENMTVVINDKAFKELKDVIPIDIYNQEFLELNAAHFSNCIFLFDDYDQIPKQSLQYQKIMDIFEQLLEKK